MRLQTGEFLGSALHAYQSAGFTLTEYSYRPGAALPRHEHQFAYLSFPLSGSYEERCGRKVFRCSPRAAVFHPDGERHEDRFDGESAQIFSVEIAPSWLDHMREDGTRTDDRVEIAAPALIHTALKLRQLLLIDDRLSPRIETIAIDLLATLTSHTRERHAPRWLPPAVDYLRATQPRRMPTPDLAKIAGVHPVHFARTFRRVYGCTISDYVRGLRVARAMQLLRGIAPLDEIALAIGFADQSHFCREFKRVAGVTPGEFRSRR